jgi:hypothetical protein
MTMSIKLVDCIIVLPEESSKFFPFYIPVPSLFTYNTSSVSYAEDYILPYFFPSFHEVSDFVHVALIIVRLFDRSIISDVSSPCRTWILEKNPYC